MENNRSCYKVILVGDTDVGKTSIITYFDKKKFKDISMITIGETNTRKNLDLDNHRRIKLDIWDTPGEKKFRDVVKTSLHNADGVILVYDIKSKDSFDSIKNYWYDEVKENVRENTRKYRYNFIQYSHDISRK